MRVLDSKAAVYADLALGLDIAAARHEATPLPGEAGARLPATLRARADHFRGLAAQSPSQQGAST